MPNYVATLSNGTTRLFEGTSYKDAYAHAKGVAKGEGLKMTDFRAEGSAPKTPRPRKAKEETPVEPEKPKVIKPDFINQPDDGKYWDVAAKEFKDETQANKFAATVAANMIGGVYRGTACWRVCYWKELTEQEYKNKWKKSK